MDQNIRHSRRHKAQILTRWRIGEHYPGQIHRPSTRARIQITIRAATINVIISTCADVLRCSRLASCCHTLQSIDDSSDFFSKGKYLEEKNTVFVMSSFQIATPMHMPISHADTHLRVSLCMILIQQKF